MNKVLITGAAGYIADQLLPTFRERYETVLVDVTDVNRRGEKVEGVIIQDLTDPNRETYARLFEGVDGVVHLGYKRRAGDNPLDHFFDEKANVEMAYNVFRCAYDAGAARVAMASPNHAAGWYEHNLIHARKMESLDPYLLPLSDNFYGWAKATYEHMGFLFACGAMDFRTPSGGQDHTGASRQERRRMGVVMVRIGAPRDIDPATYGDDDANYKRDLGAYISPRDLTQLFAKSLEAPNIENEHGVPWQVVYGISDNARAFWSLSSARAALGYAPQDDSELKYADDIRRMLSAPGRVGTE